MLILPEGINLITPEQCEKVSGGINEKLNKITVALLGELGGQEGFISRFERYHKELVESRTTIAEHEKKLQKIGPWINSLKLITILMVPATIGMIATLLVKIIPAVLKLAQ